MNYKAIRFWNELNSEDLSEWKLIKISKPQTKNIPKLSDTTIKKWVNICEDDFKSCYTFCYPLLEETKKRKLI